ncbi:uncharacterized protein LOC143975819 [Lithobates pipiens]
MVRRRRGSESTEASTMAVSWASGDPRNLQSFTSSRGSQVHHVQEEHLSLEGAYTILNLNRDFRQLNVSGEKMLETFDNITFHDFQLVRQEFPVSYLQHVTDTSSMEAIYNQGGFRIVAQTSRPGFRDLSFWSAAIASEDVEAAREKSYGMVKRVISPVMATRHEERIKAQYANSPAFKTSASRYGNFKFSFPLFSLLDLYQAQHCGGEEPQLRILGTDLYKQEVAHYILVHSPDRSDQFKNFPMVPKAQGCAEPLLNPSEPHPFVYRKNGILYWRPESTSSVLKVKISDQGIAWRECPIPCDYFIVNQYCRHIKEENYEVWSIWNHLVFAFHLPNDLCLEVSKGQLLKNLAACSLDEPALLEESKCLEIKDAKGIIRQMKSDHRMRKRMETN